MSARREGAVVRFDISDTGVGIPPHDLPHIWERLYRGDQSRAERGLGLGLSLVRAIVAAHGGTVDVEAEPGRGSTFIVTLPVDRHHALPPPTIHRPPTIHQPLTTNHLPPTVPITRM